MAKPSKSISQGHSLPAFPALPDGPIHLSGICAALGKPDDTVRKLLLRPYSEEELHSWGAAATTKDIVDDMPRFLSSALRTLQTLSPEQRKRIKLPPAIFAVVADEAATDAAMLAEHAGMADAEGQGQRQREAALKEASSRAIALRNDALSGLQNALGAKRIAATKAAASDASTPEKLSAGVSKVVAFIEDTRKKGSEEDRAALALFMIDEGTVADLEGAAKAVEDAAPRTAATGRKVSQRQLDLQDGRVLVLVDVILRAFRYAKRGDRSILQPELNRLAALFDTRARTAEEPTSPASPTGNADKKPS